MLGPKLYDTCSSKAIIKPGKDAIVSIYACGATLYFLLSGKVPPPAMERRGRDDLIPLDHLVPNVPAGMSDAIMQALAIEPERRPQDVQTFQALLMRDGQITTSTAASTSTSIPTTTLPSTSVALMIATCPRCNTFNSVPAGRSLADTPCANCGGLLGVGTTTSSSWPVSLAPSTQAPTISSMIAGKGQTLVVATLALMLLLGGGIWAKQSYEQSIAEEQGKRVALEKELTRKAEEAERKARELEEKQKTEKEQQLQSQIQQVVAAQKELEEKTRETAPREQVVVREVPAPRERVQTVIRERAETASDPEVAAYERERRRAEAKARAEKAAEDAQLARERREERAATAERRRQQEEEDARRRAEATPPPTPQTPQTHGWGGLESMTDMACKFLGKCDTRFRALPK